MTPILHFLGELGHYALTWSWQLAMLVGLLWIVLRFDRRHRPELRYRLLFLTLVLSSCFPGFPVRSQHFPGRRGSRKSGSSPSSQTPGRLRGRNL